MKLPLVRRSLSKLVKYHNIIYLVWKFLRIFDGKIIFVILEK